MKSIVIIPARYKSSRFEGKPLAMIAGKPMIQRVYENCKLAPDISDVIVVTDDRRIVDAVLEFGGKALTTLPGKRSGSDRVGEIANALELSDDDIVINVQGDQPLFNPLCLKQLVSPLVTRPKSQMSTLAFKIVNKKERTDPKDVKVVFDYKGDAVYFSRSPIPYARDISDNDFAMYKHLGFYAYTKGFLDIFRKLPQGRLEELEKLEQLRVIEHGFKMNVVVTEYDSPEVDTPEDIIRIENILKK